MKEDLLLNGNAISKIKVTLFIKFSCVAAYIEFATPDVSLSERVEEFLPISITVRFSGFAPGTSLMADWQLVLSQTSFPW